LSHAENYRDSIAAGVNMLGEELEQTMISRDYFGSIFNASSEILIVFDNQSIIKDVNKAATAKLELAKEALVGQHVSSLTTTSHRNNLKNLLDKGINLPSKTHSFELEFLASSGRKFPIICSISEIPSANGTNQCFLMVARDISHQKNEEQERLKLIISAQEQEQKRLAQDLHDSLGQQLSAIKMYLSTLNYLSSTDIETRKTLETSTSMLDQSINMVRNITFNLLPQTLEKGNLIYAVEQLAIKLKGICEVECFCNRKTIGLNTETQICIYRIIQEFINNSIKHAKGAKICSRITIKSNSVQVNLSDSGPGFDFQKIKHGNGINNIKSRLNSINADYKYDSHTEFGTTLKFDIKR
jgi:PAS domain S-box-containing protein